MTQNFLRWVLKVFPDSFPFYSYYGNYSDVGFLKSWFERTDKKLSSYGNEVFHLGFECYEEYFRLIKEMGLQGDFEVKSSKDNVTIRGSFIKSFFSSSRNKKKIIIFCHGVSNNRWSQFYSIYLALQLGYNVITYDARNHGSSDKSYTTLGEIESYDLEEVLKWTLENVNPESVGMYGFSMGASTVLHWIGKFQNNHETVKAVFCESPFDDFAKRFDGFLSNEKKFSNLRKFEGLEAESKKDCDRNGYFLKLKNYFFYNMAMKILKSPFDLHKVKPINNLPNDLKTNLLLIHGLEDSVIDYHSSVEIWNKITKNQINNDKVEIFLVEGADHDNIFFFGDFLPDKIVSYENENSKVKKNLTFSSIFYSFFEKSL